MLELDSDKRIHAEQALAHPYLAQYADPSDEPSSLPYDQTFEDYDLTVDQWKGKEICLGSPSSSSCLFNRHSFLVEYVWNEVKNFKPPVKQN